MTIKLRTSSVDLNLYGFATEMHYEKRNHKALSLEDPTASLIIELFYCVVISNLERQKKDIIKFEDFFDDIYDLNDGDSTIFNFYKWYLEQTSAQSELLKDLVEDGNRNGDNKNDDNSASEKN